MSYTHHNSTVYNIIKAVTGIDSGQEVAVCFDFKLKKEIKIVN